jgi:phage baseplate assembly protein W
MRHALSAMTFVTNTIQHVYTREYESGVPALLDFPHDPAITRHLQYTINRFDALQA